VQVRTFGRTNASHSLQKRAFSVPLSSPYAAETWSPLDRFQSRALEVFHMKCQRQLLQIKWHQFIRNEDISATTSLQFHRSARPSVTAVIAKLPDDVPAHKALNINLSLGRPPSSQWQRRPGCPRSRRVDQLRTDNNLPPADLRRRAVIRGHRGATLRPLSAKQ